MNLQIVANAILIVALVGWMGFRQLSWRPVSIAAMWRMPLILGVVGLFTLSRGSDLTRVSTLDFAVLLVEIVISLGIGALMGAIAQFRPLTSEAAQVAVRGSRRDRGQLPTIESRTGWVGFGLWIAFIVVRIGVDVVAGMMGSHLAASMGVIFIMFAANRAARTMVFAYRLDRNAVVAA